MVGQKKNHNSDFQQVKVFFRTFAPPVAPPKNAMEKIIILKRTNKGKKDEIQLRFRLRDGRSVDLFYKSDIVTTLEKLDKFDADGELHPEKVKHSEDETLLGQFRQFYEQYKDSSPLVFRDYKVIDGKLERYLKITNREAMLPKEFSVRDLEDFQSLWLTNTSMSPSRNIASSMSV